MMDPYVNHFFIPKGEKTEEPPWNNHPIMIMSSCWHHTWALNLDIWPEPC